MNGVGFPSFHPLEAVLREGGRDSGATQGKTRVSGRRSHVTKTRAGGQGHDQSSKARRQKACPVKIVPQAKARGPDHRVLAGKQKAMCQRPKRREDRVAGVTPSGTLIWKELGRRWPQSAAWQMAGQSLGPCLSV